MGVLILTLHYTASKGLRSLLTFGLLPRVREWFEDLGMSRGQKIVPPASKEAENPSTHVQDVQAYSYIVFHLYSSARIV